MELKRMNRWLWIGGVFIGIPLLVHLAFGRALIHGWAPIDDILLVTGNLAAHGLSWEHIKLAFTTYDPELYIPLTLVSFQIDYSIGGLMPYVFHLTNLILHSLNAMLAVVLLKKLTGSTWGSVIGGLLFAVHPLHTEAVVWITGRKDLFFAFFSLLSLIFWMDREKGHRWTVLSILTLLLALLSKVTAVIVFPLLVLIDLYKGKSMAGNSLKRYAPGLILCLIFGIVSFGGKERVLGSQPIFEVVMTGFRSIWYYVTQMFVPTNLAISHEWIGSFTVLNSELIAGVILTVCVTWAAWHFRYRMPWLWFGWAFFLLALIPTFLGSRKGGTLLFAVDRYGYIPSIGVLFLLVMTGKRIADRWNARAVIGGVSALGIIVAILVSRVQTKTWDSPEALFGQALKVTPASVGSRVSLASVLLQANDIQGSFEVLREGLQYGEDRLLTLTAADVYAKAGDTASAREQFAKVLNTIPNDPDALFGIASLDEQMGNTDAALSGYTKAVDADPSFVSARNGIARISLERGESTKAEDQLTLALKWNPSSGESHRLMGQLLEKQKDFAEAEEHYRKQLSVDGESAEVLLSLARVLIEQGKKDDARMHVERVLEVQPRNQEARDLSGRM